MLNVFHASGMSHILDDFFFVGPPNSISCSNDLASFLFLCKSIGVPIKMEKIQAPTTNIVIYGIEVDSVNMECRLPVDKIQKIQDKLHLFKKTQKGHIKRHAIHYRSFKFCLLCCGSRANIPS